MTVATRSISTGRRSRKITIQTPTDSRDGTGDNNPTWATFATAWAEFRAVSGRERDYDNQVVTEATHRATIPYIASLTTKMRVVLDSVNYGIDRIDDRDHANIEQVLYLKVEV